MNIPKEAVFITTIALTVGTVLLTVVVVVIGCFLRKLRKRVEAELSSKDKVEHFSSSQGVGNKYTPSKRIKNEGDPECYESPQLTEAQRQRLQNTNNSSDDAEQHIPRAQPNELIELRTRSRSNDCILMLNDDVIQGGDEFYTEAMDDFNDKLTKTFQIESKPTPAIPKPLPTQHKPKHMTGRVTHQHPMSRHPENSPQRSNNAKANSRHQMKQDVVFSKQAATRGSDFAQANVRQYQAQRGAMKQSSHSEITANQSMEEDYYYQMMQSLANQTHEEEEFYENQEMIDGLKSTGGPKDDDEIYENKETIKRQRANQYRQHMATDEQLYMNY